MCSPCPSRRNRHVSIINGILDSSISSSLYTRKEIPKSFLGSLRSAIFSRSDEGGRLKTSESLDQIHYIDISQGTSRRMKRDPMPLNQAPPVRRVMPRICASPSATPPATREPLRAPSAPKVPPPAVPAKVLTCPKLSSRPVAKLKKDPPANWKRKAEIRTQPPLAYAVQLKKPSAQRTLPGSPAKASTSPGLSSRHVGRMKKDEPANWKMKANLRTPPLPTQPLRSAPAVGVPANLASKNTARPSAPTTSPSRKLTSSKARASAIDIKTKSAARPTPPAIVISPATPSLPLQSRPSSRDILAAHAYESKISSLRLALIRRQAHHKDLEARISVLNHQIGTLAAQNVVEKEGKALAIAKTLMQKNEIAELMEKFAQSRELVEAYRGEMAGLRARIAELEAVGALPRVLRTGMSPASPKASVSPQKLEIDEPQTLRASKIPVSPKTPAAPRKPRAPGTRPSKTLAAAQAGELFLPRMQEQQRQQKRTLPSSRRVRESFLPQIGATQEQQRQQKPSLPSSRWADESFLPRIGATQEPTPPSSPRPQLISTATFDFSMPIVQPPTPVYRVRFKEMAADRVLPEMDTFVWASVPDLYLRDPTMWI